MLSPWHPVPGKASPQAFFYQDQGNQTGTMVIKERELLNRELLLPGGIWTEGSDYMVFDQMLNQHEDLIRKSAMRHCNIKTHRK